MGEPVIGVCEGAFAEAEWLEKVVIEDGIQKIERFAFCMCKNLKEVHLPESITEIGGGAFEGCGRLRSIVIPDNVKVLESDTFSLCSHLRYVALPRSIQKIECGAFEMAGTDYAPAKTVQIKPGRSKAIADEEKINDKKNYGIMIWIPKSNFSEFLGEFSRYAVLYFEGNEEDAAKEWSKYDNKPLKMFEHRIDKSEMPQIYRYNVTKEEFLDICKSL